MTGAPLVFLPLFPISLVVAGTERLGKRQGYLRVITIEIVGAPATNPLDPLPGIPFTSVQGVFGSLRGRWPHSNGQGVTLKGDLHVWRTDSAHSSVLTYGIMLRILVQVLPMEFSTGEYLTTREVAQLLRVKERKVYDLVAREQIPCTKATGKLLFPKGAIKIWLASNRTGPKTAGNLDSAPNVILGSHDPLLEWALKESDCAIASHFGGSVDGLERFAQKDGIATGLHIYEPETGGWNIDVVRQRFTGQDIALVEFCWRQRGLIVQPGKETVISGIADLPGRRVVKRVTGTGSQILLDQLIRREGISPSAIDFSAEAHTETEAASAVLEGLTDAALGLKALAERYQLGFVPLIRERFDLLIYRRSWFEPSLQALAQFCASSDFYAKVKSLAGYDTRGLGTVHFNG